MNRVGFLRDGCLLWAVLGLCVPGAWAATPDDPAADRPDSDVGAFRPLAPGVARTIPVEREVHETFSRYDIPELLAIDPDFDWARDVRFQHDIWNLEFTFKPIRFVTVEMPGRNGKLERRQVWYMVYRVRNVGSEPVEFVPYFVLESREAQKFYPDRLVPLALPAIQQREDSRRRFADTVDIAGPIPPSSEDDDRSVWGVVTWTDIDPRTDHLSI